MMNIRKTRLAVAVAGAVSLVTFNAQAEDFTASTTLQNTLTVVNVLDFDIGTVFASVTGVALTNGVGAIVISPDGVVSDPADSASVSLTSLTTPVPAQGSIAMTANFSMTLPDTSTIDATDFTANGGAGNIANITTIGTELIHESANPSVPSLYLMHFTVGDVSGGVSTETGANLGVFNVVPDFGETTFVFNIGATLTTKPTTGSESYQEGVYSGTFEVTAAY